MALRPWNVFKKTYYVSKAGGPTLSVASQLSLARARLQAEEAGADALGGTFVRRLGLLLPPAVSLWLLLLAARWRYQDEEKMRALDASQSLSGTIFRDFLGWRVAAHFGPYQVPNLVRAHLHEEPLRLLRRPVLLDHERAKAIGRLQQLSQRKLAARSLGPLGSLEPLLLDALAPPGVAAEAAALGSTLSSQAASLRVVMDVLGALPPEERAAPAWVLGRLVAARGETWDAAQGPELKATLLCQLFRSPDNCREAVAAPEVLAYLQQTGMKRKEHTWLIFPIKAYLLSGETPDLLRRCLRLVARECPDAVEVPPRRARDTPSLQTKRDLRSVWTTALGAVAWALLRSWRGVIDAGAVAQMAAACGGALAGTAVLEGVWRIEEQVIESEWYFADSRAALAASAGMCLVNCVTLAWAARWAAIVPFAFARLVKDDFLDAHRSFEV